MNIRRDASGRRIAVFIAATLLPPCAWASANISINDASVTEGNSGTTTLPFTISRSGDTYGQIVLRYLTDDSSATAPSDYVSIANGSVTVPAGQTSAAVNVTVNGDTTAEGDENFFLRLTNAVAVGSTPSFALASNFGAGAMPASVAATDVNGDGRLDLAVANTNSNDVSVLLNTTAPGAATASYAAASQFAAGSSPNSVTATDINGDGRADLAVANNSSNTVSVLLNTTAPGATTPNYAVAANFAVGSAPRAVTATDVNGDGRPDLAVANFGSGNVTVLINTTAPGASTATYAAPSNVSLSFLQPSAVTAVDANGDRRPDLVVTYMTLDRVSVLLNTTASGASTASYAAASNFTVGSDPRSVTPTDVNSDGWPDLAVANGGSNDVSVLINTTAPGAGTPSFANANNFAVSGNPQSVTAVDVNNDGRADLAVTNTAAASNNVSVLLNTTAPGAITSSYAVASNFAVGTGPVSVTAVDVNNDSRADLAVTNAAAASNNVSVLLNTANVGVSAASLASASNFGAGTEPRSVAVGDVNGDGRPDVAVANQISDNVSVLLNNTISGAPAPSFAAPSHFATGDFSNSVALGDVNNDGKPDLAVANNFSSSISVLLNTTSPGAAVASFSAASNFSAGGAPALAILRDLNGDGKDDLIVANSGGSNVSVLLNATSPGATTPSFAAASSFTLSAGPRAVAVGDINGDGKPDLATANEGANSVSVLLNTTAPGAASPTFAGASSFAAGVGLFSVALADVNGDGRLDIIDNTVAVLLNATTPGATSPSFSAPSNFGAGGGAFAVALGDVSGDGRLDVVVVNSADNTVSALLNTTEPGATVPGFSSQQTFGTGRRPASVAVADVNGDRTPDLLVANSDASANTVSVLLNQLFTVQLIDGEGVGTIQNDDSAADTTPDAFTLTDQSNVATSTVVTSNSITVAGINAATSISISGGGGEYSIAGGAFTSSPGTVTNGQTVRVRHTSAATGNTATNSTLSIGGVSDTFTSTTRPDPDTTPNAFTFPDQTGVATTTVVTSDAVVISGIDAPAGVTVAGGEYSIGGAAFTAAAGTITNGQSVQVRHTSAAAGSTPTNTTLTVGGVSDTFTSTTRVDPDTRPDPFTFQDQSGVATATVVTSSDIVVTGIDSAAPISVAGGEYSIGGAAFTASPGTVTNGQNVRVRHTSAATGNTATNTTLTIGGVSDTFTSTTVNTGPSDSTPEPFAFVDQSGVELVTVVTSAPVTVTGIDVPADISIAGGEYSVDGGPFTASPGTVTSGQTLRVRHTSADTGSTATNTALIVGGVGDTFTSTTRQPDTTPDAFVFTDESSVVIGAVIVSNPITVSGIDTAAAISVVGGEYNLDGGAFTSSAGTVGNGQVVRVRHTAAAAPNTAVSTALTIGGVNDTFTSTTGDPDTTPDPFTFIDLVDQPLNSFVVSNAIVVSGIDAPAPISVEGGQYQIDGGAFTGTAGTVSNGQTVRVRVQSAPANLGTVQATVVIGGFSDIFAVRTEPICHTCGRTGGDGGPSDWRLLALLALLAARRRLLVDDRGRLKRRKAVDNGRAPS